MKHSPSLKCKGRMHWNAKPNTYKLKVSKIKAMVVSKTDNDKTANIKVRNLTISLVDNLMAHDNKSTKEIKRRTTPPKQAFKKKRTILTNTSV